MSDVFPGEALVEAVNDVGVIEWSGIAYRHTGRGRDPLSGDGARLNGGRWNSPGRPTIYLAQPIETCVLEFARMAEATGATPASLVRRGWHLHQVEVAGVSVLDLSTTTALRRVGLDPEDIADDDWTACQTVGEAAHFLSFAGVVAPSATGSGLVIAAFEDRIGAGQLKLRSSESLDEPTYLRYIDQA